MNQDAEIALTKAEMSIVNDVLSIVIPEREVWAFGSRVHRRALKRMSDLDICVLGEERIPPHKLAMMTFAFDESLLPFKVDIVDWATTSERFRATIEAEHVVLQHARPPSNEHATHQGNRETA